MIEGFPPISAPDARCLILGSVPGNLSLQAAQYYAHPRNQFWPIMLKLFQGQTDYSYAERCQMLQKQQIALWDVVQRCQRQGSLDAAIQTDSIVINDFESFFQDHPAIEYVCFNGNTAAHYFRRWVHPKLSRSFHYLKLPSTSPAHASLDWNAKLAEWQALLKLDSTTTHNTPDSQNPHE